MRSGLVFGAALAACVLLVGGAIWWATAGRSGSPVRVLVALRGSVSEQHDRLLVEQVADELHELGFDAQPADAPIAGAGPAGIEEVLDAADAIGAGYTVLLDVAVARVRDGLEPGTALYDASLAATLIPTSVQPGASLPTRRIDFAFERSSEPDVAVFVRRTWVRALSADAAGWIYADPEFDAAVMRGSLSVAETAFAVTIREHAEAADGRNDRAERFAEYCAREREAFAAVGAAEAGIECTGDPCGQWTLLGVDASGRALVQDISRDPYFPIVSSGIAWAELPERVLAVPLARGAEPALVYRTGHFFGFGAASPSGRYVSIQPFGMQALHVLVAEMGADGAAAPVVAGTLGDRERTAVTAPHPAGRGALALIDRNWYYLHDGERVVLPNMEGAAWLEREGQEPSIVGVTGTAWVLVRADGSLEAEPVAIEGDAPERESEMIGVAGSEVWAQLATYGGCQLSRFDPAARTVRTTALPACLDSPVLVGDGRIAGVAGMSGGAPAARGHAEVVIVDPESLAITALTSGPLEEEVVYVTGGEHPRVVFNRRLEDWPSELDLGIYRRVVCWTDVR
jgi:hypothetical protein